MAALDASLLKVSKQISRIPTGLFQGLEDEPESSPLCPLDNCAPDNTKINCARNLDARLTVIHVQNPEEPGSSSIPEIRLESGIAEVPEISLSEPETRRKASPATVVLSNSGNVHPKHLSALLRLLYLHSAINPGNLSPHIPALLVPLYSVLSQEIEIEDLAHVEGRSPLPSGRTSTKTIHSRRFLAIRGHGWRLFRT